MFEPIAREFFECFCRCCRGSLVVHLLRRQRFSNRTGGELLLVKKTVRGTHVQFTLQIIVAAALVVVPGLACAQDDRIDDPPEPAQPAITGAPAAAASGILTEPRLLTSRQNADAVSGISWIE